MRDYNIIPGYLIFSLCFFILNTLGVWQLNKHYYIKKKNSYFLSNQLKNPTFFKSIDNKFNDYQFVEVNGVFKENKALFFEPRTYKGKIGFHKLVPFKVLDKYILVNRGFIKEKTLYKNSDEIISLTGTILRIPTPNYFSLNNDIKKNRWHTIHIDEISRYLNLNLIPYVLYEKNIKNYDFKPVLPRTISKVNHLQYAITWFLLALTMAIIFIIFLREKNGKK